MKQRIENALKVLKGITPFMPAFQVSVVKNVTSEIMSALNEADNSAENSKLKQKPKKTNEKPIQKTAKPSVVSPNPDVIDKKQ